jgi:5-oxoprolinase (ATP-hydrolysing)
MDEPRPTSPPGKWRICIDTGGTFTDCAATAPDGTRRTAKVLSTGALRGDVAAVLGPRALAARESWGAPAGFLVGWRLRPLGSPASGASIIAHTPTPEGSILGLDRDVTIAPGHGFELLCDEESPIVAARLVTGTMPGDPLPCFSMRLATTRGTNALLEGRGAEVALFITAGFGDLLRIGTQQRPDLFALNIVKPEPLYSHVVEVEERLGPVGDVVRPLNLEALRGPALRLLADGVRVAAVALMRPSRSFFRALAFGTFPAQPRSPPPSSCSTAPRRRSSTLTSPRSSSRTWRTSPRPPLRIRST